MGQTLTLVMHRNKAVAACMVLYCVEHFATRRISKFTYGTPYETRTKAGVDVEN